MILDFKSQILALFDKLSFIVFTKHNDSFKDFEIPQSKWHYYVIVMTCTLLTYLCSCNILTRVLMVVEFQNFDETFWNLLSGGPPHYLQLKY